jgi:2-polyprenyl-3-methyl-5-hydroxy-6-metoxy-1,4-benzoquinol methylase
MTMSCKLCGSTPLPFGSKRGRLTHRAFHFYRCPDCRFVFVGDPWTEYDKIYSEAYYRGLGVDPYIDYVYESNHQQETIRVYEWRGILDNIMALTSIRPETRWLDFGCGQGGLLHFCLQQVKASFVGFEEGWLSAGAATVGYPILRDREMLSAAAPFDIITAIEVLEHVPDPVETVALFRRLLKPAGLFFYTTGNPEPYLNNFIDWEYVYPEIHVSYFEPDTMARLLKDTGFHIETPNYLPGYSNIIRYKVLKRLGLKRQSIVEKALPWSLVSRAIDRRLKITRYPIARG